EVRAGDRSHVHHIIVYVKEPKPTPRPVAVTIRPILSAAPARPQPAAPPATPRPATAAPAASGNSRTGDQMLVNWAVGEDAPVFPAGIAKRIPAGATLIFQVHYTTNGTPGRDRSKVGFILSKEAPAREIRTGLISNPVFAIPA